MVTSRGVLLSHHLSHVYRYDPFSGALYDYEVLIFTDIACGDCRVPQVRGWLQDSQDIQRALKENLRVAQSQWKMHEDRYRTEGTFEEVVS
jgi:hypothetical protein